MSIVISLVDTLVNVESAWLKISSYYSREETKKTTWIARAMALEPDRILQVASPRADAIELVESLASHITEPDIIIWCPGEARPEVGMLALRWLEKYDLKGDILTVCDSVRKVCSIWNPDLLITRSSTLALQAVEKADVPVAKLDDFPGEEIIKNPEEFFPEMISPANKSSQVIQIMEYIYEKEMKFHG